VKLLVTGGAGYIGCVVTHRLAASGHEVVVVDDLSTGHRDNVPSHIEFHQLSLHDIAKVLTPQARFDGVIHLAAKAEVAESVAAPDLYWRTNLDGTLTLLRAMHAAGMWRLVTSSTYSVYAHSGAEAATEDSPLQPASPYAETKLAVDLILTAEARTQGLAATSFRYGNAAGAVGGLGERHRPETHLIPVALQVAGGHRERLVTYGMDYPTEDGSCVRDYVHVDDLATAHLLALEAMERGRHAVYNLGNGRGYSNLEVVDVVRQVTGREVPMTVGPRRAGDAAVTVVCSDRARREIGWTPARTSLDEIVRSAWQFQLARDESGR
jgi:UDP-glucose 4-epimerase